MPLIAGLLVRCCLRIGRGFRLESKTVLGLTHLPGARIFAAQVLIQCRLEFGYPGGGDVPDLVDIHPDLVVDEDVAHATDRLPIERC
jgi:hypothetical protein